LVTLKSAALVNVALAAKVKLVGAVKVVAVVFRFPFKTKVLVEKSRIPPVGTPFKVTLPPVLVI